MSASMMMGLDRIAWAIFTVGEAVRSTCGNSHDDDEEEDHFHLSALKPSYDLIIATYGLHHGYRIRKPVEPSKPVKPTKPVIS